VSKRRPRAQAAALAALMLAAFAAAQPAPAWFQRARDAAVARALVPLEGDELTAAEVEARRAAAARLPRLRLSERSRLGLDAAFELELQAGLSLPLSAPATTADRRLTGERLAAARRQLAARRREELHDDLANAVALLETRARLRALDALRAATAHPHASEGGRPAPSATGPASAPAPPASAAPWAPPVSPVDVQLLLANRNALLRRDRALRGELRTRLGVRVPVPPKATPRASGAPYVARDPLGLVAAELEPQACVTGSDAVARARLAARDRRLAAALDRARSLPHAELELSGTARLGSQRPQAGYGVRLGVSLSLPPWSRGSGAASLAIGAEGLEQSLEAAWPNRAPAAPPGNPPHDAGADPDVLEAARTVRGQLELLVGQEADLLARRRILLRALSAPLPATLAGAYRSATLALQLADADEGLGVTRLDTALLCGALPP